MVAMGIAEGTCRFCGAHGQGEAFERWVRPTFTDHDKLLPGEIVCDDCLFWFQESSESLARTVGKWWATGDEALAANPDRVKKFLKAKKRQPEPGELFSVGEKGGWYIPQRMRNYSQFIVGEQWRPLSKGQKAEMSALLTAVPFPELAVVAESGQKHIVFRGRRNPVGSVAGWVQMEEDTIWVDPGKLRDLLEVVEALMVGFGIGQIESGEYYQKLIMEFGFAKWHALEQKVKPYRGWQLLRLAIFLGQMPGELEQELKEVVQKVEKKVAVKRPLPTAKKPEKVEKRPSDAAQQMSLF